MSNVVDVPPVTSLTLRETLSPLERISIQLSPSSPPERVREAVSYLAGDSVKVSSVDKTLKFMIGKACLMVKQRKLYREFGYRCNEAYLKAEVYRPGLSRPTVWKGIGIVRAFPDAAPSQLASLPESSLTLAAQIVARQHLTPRRAAKVLLQVERMSVSDFADSHGKEAERKGFSVIRILTSKSFKKEFEIAAGEDPEKFLKALIRRPMRSNVRQQRAA